MHSDAALDRKEHATLAGGFSAVQVLMLALLWVVCEKACQHLQEVRVLRSHQLGGKPSPTLRVAGSWVLVRASCGVQSCGKVGFLQWSNHSHSGRFFAAVKGADSTQDQGADAVGANLLLRFSCNAVAYMDSNQYGIIVVLYMGSDRAQCANIHYSHHVFEGACYICQSMRLAWMCGVGSGRASEWEQWIKGAPEMPKSIECGLVKAPLSLLKL